jgi:hypothetical protein
MDAYGEYNERARELLVMIDNIDNPRCKKDIISRLHNGNWCSIKTFEHITGIKLEKTQKARRAQIETITKADYKDTPKQFKPRKTTEKVEYSDTFYKVEFNYDTKKSEFVEAIGRLWRYNGYDFYVAHIGDNYRCTEGKTGLLVSSGNTLKEVQDLAKQLTNNMRGGKPLQVPFAYMISQAIEKSGLSPLYTE